MQWYSMMPLQDIWWFYWSKKVSDCKKLPSCIVLCQLLFLGLSVMWCKDSNKNKLNHFSICFQLHLNFTFIRLLPILQNGGVAVWRKVRRLSDLQVAPSLVAPPTFLSVRHGNISHSLIFRRKKLFVVRCFKNFPFTFKNEYIFIGKYPWQRCLMCLGIF